MPGRPDPDLACLDQCPKDKLYRLVNQFASISIRMSRLKFAAIGSLDASDHGDIRVGVSADFMFVNDQGKPCFFGPWYSLRDRYLAVVNHILTSTRKGYMYRSGLLLPYLRSLELRWFLLSSTALARDKTFYLTHPDLHSLNILSESGDVTGLVDWQWATTTTKAEAFASPVWLRGYGPELSLGETLLRDAYIRAGREDLANCVSGGRLYHDLRDAFYLDFTREEEALRVLNRITLSSSDKWDESTLSPSAPACSLAHWGLQALERYRNDPYLQDVISLDATLEGTRRPAEKKEWDSSFGPRPVRWTPESLRLAVEERETNR